ARLGRLAAARDGAHRAARGGRRAAGDDDWRERAGFRAGTGVRAEPALTRCAPVLTDRRTFLRSSMLAAGAVAMGPGFWRDAFAATPAQPGPGPYGPLQPADANGIELPAGFTSRRIAQGEQTVAGTSYQWHVFPDGQATYATPD